MNNPGQDNRSQIHQIPGSTQLQEDQQQSSQASVEVPSGSKLSRFFVVVLIITALLGGGLLGYLSLQGSTTQDTTPEPTRSPQPKREPFLDYAGEETIILRDVRGLTASGQATRMYRTKEPVQVKFSITANLPAPSADDAFYQVWLVEDVNDLATWVPLSILWKGGNGYSMENEYNLPSEPSPLTSYYAYNTIVITLETGDSAHVTADDGVVGPKVLEGSFTQ